jgi:hypothetical protein
MMADEYQEQQVAKKFPENAAERPQVQNFIHNLHAPYGTIGSGIGGYELPRRRVTGRLDRDEVRASLKTYLPPDSHDDALRLLRSNHVIVIAGQQGLGKRTGALKLLDEVAAQGLVELPPVALEALAENAFKAGHGYLACGYKDMPGDADADADVAWLAIRAKAREAKAYLVVTVNRELTRRASDSVRQVVWQAPDPADFLALHTDPETATRILGRLDDFCTMETLARIAAHRDLDSALEELRASSIEPILTWFEKPKPREAILDLAALAFLPGISERLFEQLRAPLTKLLAEHMPMPPDTPQEAETSLVRGRGRQVITDELVVRNKDQGRTVLYFAAPAYHTEILAQLSRWYSTPFWEALREWLSGVVADGTDRLRAAIAYGLCQLALDNLEEVEVSYLEPWSRYELGWAGHETATYLLWLMSEEERLAASALATAIRWSSSSFIEQRWTAAVVFSGVLGLRYPFEAVRRLWSIGVQGKDLSEDAILALAMLFANLVAQNEKVDPVLRLLELRLEQFARPGADSRLKSIALEAVLTVFSAGETEGERPALVPLLVLQPEASPRVAGLLATMLQFRPCRARSMDVLAKVLQSLQGDDERGWKVAYRLCVNLARALPKDEQIRLNKEFTTRLQSRPETASIADILRAALDKASAPDNDPTMSEGEQS